MRKLEDFLKKHNQLQQEQQRLRVAKACLNKDECEHVEKMAKSMMAEFTRYDWEKYENETGNKRPVRNLALTTFIIYFFPNHVEIGIKFVQYLTWVYEGYKELKGYHSSSPKNHLRLVKND